MKYTPFVQLRFPTWHWVYLGTDNNIYNNIGGYYFKFCSLEEFYKLKYHIIP